MAALWNYAEPGEKVAAKEFRLKVVHGGARKYSLQIVDPAHGSALGAWNKMGKPASPTQRQIEELVEASKLAPASEHAIDESIRVDAQGLALVVIK